MIEINIDKKQFDKVIFENAKIVINDGDFIGIKGPSGAGKSTLLSIIGMLESFEGKYYIDGELIKPSEKLRKNNFSYIFQKPYLLSYLNVYDNLVMPLKNLKIKVDKSEIENLSKKLGIFDLLDKYPAYLSGGECQRITILRAFLARRKYILIDEPTGSLDPNNSSKVLELFKILNEEYGATLVMVTHSNDYDSYFNRRLYIDSMEIKEYDK